MGVDLFKRILDKILNEKVTINDFYVGNWGEPLLNPDLWKILFYAEHTLHPQQILVNSNLSSKMTEPERLLLSGLSELRASVSGMTQEVYQRNHRNGDIGRVLNNLVELNEIKKRLGIESPKLTMVYHQYLYNNGEKWTAVDFCQSNDIQFMPIRPYVCSVEEGVRFHQDESVRKTYAEFIDINDEMARMRTIPENASCNLTDQLVINFDGRVFKCCGTYGEGSFLGNFFDWKIEDIMKSNPDICRVCKSTPLSWR